MQEFKGEDTNEKVRIFSQAISKLKLMERINAVHDEMVEEGFVQTKWVKIKRNDECPCSSGLKFKKCCIDKVGNRIKI